MATKFVPIDIILAFHEDLLRRYGGSGGVRDRNLLESAIGQPKATFAGKHLHRTLFDKAAAYGFHLARNHPFVDGNKRIAFVVMDIFLSRNGWDLVASEEEAYAMMMELAQGRLAKSALSEWLKKRSRRLSS